MHIDITALSQGVNELESVLDPESLDIKSEDLVLKAPVKVSLRLDVTGDDIRIDGVVRAVVEEECSRCLTAFKRDLEAELHLYAIGAGRRRGDPEADEDQGEGMLVHDGRRLDLWEEVRSAILLSTPMQPLCDPGCKGLCAACGANLNNGQCKCGERRIDPRWKGLDKLRGQ
jgi:uncharacterized protein